MSSSRVTIQKSDQSCVRGCLDNGGSGEIEPKDQACVQEEELALAPRLPGNTKVVAALVRGIECKDHHVGVHLRDVANTAWQIGLEMGLLIGELGPLFIGGLLHDVGKIAIPRAVLSKPEPLTPEESALIRLHPGIGAKILKHLWFPSTVISAAKYHHERFDGEGYPEGLGGKDIPLAARVISAADALGAMTRKRPYCRGVCRDKALEEIVRNADTQFDSKVVQALVQVEESANIRSQFLSR
jgi:HD-GYP domain-containing protein (c-di-GMP phosphodiesterase class II)